MLQKEGKKKDDEDSKKEEEDSGMWRNHKRNDHSGIVLHLKWLENFRNAPQNYTKYAFWNLIHTSYYHIAYFKGNDALCVINLFHISLH